MVFLYFSQDWINFIYTFVTPLYTPSYTHFLHFCYTFMYTFFTLFYTWLECLEFFNQFWLDFQGFQEVEAPNQRKSSEAIKANHTKTIKNP